LAEGLADTIRVSLTASPEKEVVTAYEILRSLGLDARGVNFVSCPTCGRTEVDLMSIAGRVERAVRGIRTRMTVAVMGCAVNGPGEAREADIGLACGRGTAVIFKKGRMLKKVRARNIVRDFVAEVRKLAREQEGER
jgi:(E)-4-hydroxy-3-methylbut-2-enyl-diphosphate synthase